ncbi:MAG: hypothetical protein KGY48_08855 [Wenzhouxiangellaceae bacterium]|jgi:predicted small lipoprotein YifL|nr:hypothetical protein [Wenzhouxiangellaceae bacterium]MBS3745611.1 hypothetical protein [Wenzhouxiangellaceae bacterium]MBS3823395.1 hypothetical protein [Wenzhouxiangellaceae bacterium]
MPRILPSLRLLLFALATIPAGLMSGCGLKGDLVIPDAAEPAAATEPEQDEDDQPEDPAGR